MMWVKEVECSFQSLISYRRRSSTFCLKSNLNLLYADFDFKSYDVLTISDLLESCFFISYHLYNIE